MRVTILREKRKTIVLSLIDENSALLKVPKHLSDNKISEFLESKKRWLENKAQKINQDKEFSKAFDIKNCFYLFGKQEGKFEDLILGFNTMSEKEKGLHIRKYYLSHFSNLEDVVLKLSEKTGLVFEKIKSTAAKTIWGSYSSDRIMKLNWKLLLLPKELVNYVVIHELCHSKHMNHKPQFWRDVAKFCPDFKLKRKQLNQYGFLLKACF